MSGQVTLEELETYNAEKLNAARENRPCKYRDPRDVFAEDPDRDSYLVELTDDELAESNSAADEPDPGTAVVSQSVYLSDPGQELAEEAALKSNDGSGHQNTQETPEVELNTTVDTPDDQAVAVNPDETPEEVLPAEVPPTETPEEEVPTNPTVPGVNPGDTPNPPETSPAETPNPAIPTERNFPPENPPSVA